MRDEAEQLEFVGIEHSALDGSLVARMRNLDAIATEWLADLHLIELRMARAIPARSPRGATKAALAALLNAQVSEHGKA